MTTLSKNSLTELHKFILHIMYQMELFPNSPPQKTSKVIAEIIFTANNYFSDSINKHIEALYAMAQPWNIDIPLIKCRGYIGSPEQKKYLYSRAASPFYTEVVLTEEGMDYIKRNNLQTFHLQC